MSRIVTFGELLLRLKSPAYERFLQSPSLEATFGGAEANVAVSLANFGMDTSFVTALPDNPIADAAIRELRGFGVNTDSIVRTAGGRMGIYFLEAGANQRPSMVVYDRADSSMARAAVADFDFSGIFDRAEWFHISGITPAISRNAAELSLAAVKAAKAGGLTVSCDLNYRKNLWQYGADANDIMSEITKYTDVVIANEEACQKALGIETGDDNDEVDANKCKKLALKVFESYPNLQKVALTFRRSKSASHNDWSGCICDGRHFYASRKYEIKNIVDRIGGGDAFSGGLIYGLLNFKSDADTIEFAVAASCLKHSVPGDYSRFTVKEVKALMGGNDSCRVQR